MVYKVKETEKMNREYQLFCFQPQTTEIGIHYKGIKLIKQISKPSYLSG